MYFNKTPCALTPTAASRLQLKPGLSQMSPKKERLDKLWHIHAMNCVIQQNRKRTIHSSKDESQEILLRESSESQKDTQD